MSKSDIIFAIDFSSNNTPAKGAGFLYQTHSRSGVALQTERSINFIKFTPTPYITEILKKARRKLK